MLQVPSIAVGHAHDVQASKTNSTTRPCCAKRRARRRQIRRRVIRGPKTTPVHALETFCTSFSASKEHERVCKRTGMDQSTPRRMRIFSIPNVGTKRRWSEKERKAHLHHRQSSDGHSERIETKKSNLKCRAQRYDHAFGNDRRSSLCRMWLSYFGLARCMCTYMYAKMPTRGSKSRSRELLTVSIIQSNFIVILRPLLTERPFVMVFLSCTMSFV